MDDDDTGAAVTVAEVLSDAFRPLQEMSVSSFGSKMRAQSLPSCRMESTVMSSIDNSEDSSFHGVNVGSQECRKGLFENSNNFILHSSENKELTLFRNPDSSGLCHSQNATIRNSKIAVGESISQIGRDDCFELNSGDGRDETDSAYSSADNNSQVMDDFGGNMHSTCSRCTNCGHVFNSKTKSNSGIDSCEAQNQGSSRTIKGVPRPFESESLGIPKNIGEDMPDLVRPSSPVKRKDIEDERPTKRVKNGLSDEGSKQPVITSANLPPVDIQGHGNIALVGNDNLTINIIQNGGARDDDDNVLSQCWKWSGTCQKEIEVENVSGVLRRIADGLVPHVDYKRVARHLEFPDMATLEDDLLILSRKKCSAADKIFFVLVRWWKSNKFGSNQTDIKTEIGYLLQDLNLRRMKSNLKQYFD